MIVYPDGTVVVNGNNGRFIGKGEGVAVADLGRTVTTVEGLVFSAGQHSETLFPDVCAALDWALWQPAGRRRSAVLPASRRPPGRFGCRV